MSPEQKANTPEPPEVPQINRRLQLGPMQWGALAFFALIPLLAAVGVLYDAGPSRDSIWRVSFVYIFLMVAFRLTGKREVGQMSALELVTLMMIPEIFSVAINKNNESLPLATIGVATLFLAVFLTGLLKFSSQKAEDLLEGRPTVLVHEGKYLETNMRRERVTPDEIHAEMRIAGIQDLKDVRWAILENEGKVSIIAARPDGPKATSATRI